MTLFKQLEKEKRQKKKGLVVETNPILEEMIGCYKGSFKEFELTHKKQYGRCHDILKDHSYHSKDIEMFSLRMSEFQDRKDFFRAGLFVSALINSSPDENFTVHTTSLEASLNDIGYKNLCKNIIVRGNVGHSAGECMMGGVLHIYGDVGPLAGLFMDGGDVIVEGNAGHSFGCNLIDGNLIVKGNAGDLAGNLMQAGSISIEGDTKDALGYEMCGGKIYVKGRIGKCPGDSMNGGEIHYNNGRLIIEEGKKRFIRD